MPQFHNSGIYQIGFLIKNDFRSVMSTDWSKVNHMNVYVVTENKYLYQGILHSLTKFSNYTVMLTPTNDAERNEVVEKLTCDDLLLLIADTGYKYDFQFLVAVSRCQARVIYSGAFEHFHFQHMFGFSIIGVHFLLSDLMQAIYLKNNIKRTFRLPKITLQEKEILFHTYKGNSVAEMAGFLYMHPKTVYRHQRSVLKKIGVRKPKDLYLLPENLVEQFYQSHSD